MEILLNQQVELKFLPYEYGRSLENAAALRENLRWRA